MQNRAAIISKYKMINVDDHTNKNRKEHGNMVIYFRSSIQIINSKRSEKKCVIRFNYPSTKNWYNISLCKRSIWGKISIFN